MKEHALLGGTLKVNSPFGVEGQREGVVASCTCGWSSAHVSSLAASTAFREHQEHEDAKSGANQHADS